MYENHMYIYNGIFVSLKCCVCFADASGYIGSYFGPGINSPVFSDIHCSGSEMALTDCDYSSAANCSINQLAGVRCSGPLGPCEAAGHTECCLTNCSITNSNETCFCNADCHNEGNCCMDINTTCPRNGNRCITKLQPNLS